MPVLGARPRARAGSRAPAGLWGGPPPRGVWRQAARGHTRVVAHGAGASAGGELRVLQTLDGHSLLAFEPAHDKDARGRRSSPGALPALPSSPPAWLSLLPLSAGPSRWQCGRRGGRRGRLPAHEVGNAAVEHGRDGRPGQCGSGGSPQFATCCAQGRKSLPCRGLQIPRTEVGDHAAHRRAVVRDLLCKRLGGCLVLARRQQLPP